MGTRLYVTILCLCLSGAANAQYYEWVRSVCPGQSVNPRAIGESIFQIRVGAEAGWSDRSDDEAVYNNRYKFGEGILSYGISHRLQADALLTARQDKAEVNGVRTQTSGVNIAALGCKFNIYDGGNRGFSLGIQGLIKTPWLSPDYKTTYYAPRLVALLGYNPSSGINLTGNVGLDYDGINKNPAGIYSLQAAFMLNDNLGTFVETYGNIQHGIIYNHVDLGLYCYFSRHFEADVYGGLGMQSNLQDEGFIAAGITYRFSTVSNRNRWIYGQYR